MEMVIYLRRNTQLSIKETENAVNYRISKCGYDSIDLFWLKFKKGVNE